MRPESDLIESSFAALAIKHVRLDMIEYGYDHTGDHAVWLHIEVDIRRMSKKKAISTINGFSNALCLDLISKGLEPWPYIRFHLKQKQRGDKNAN
ncbi:hypothetical protein AWB71_05266 [Caballeronia peredens]|nr:hypothetical protein AWB71_05266 [Caballeronia peredens]